VQNLLNVGYSNHWRQMISDVVDVLEGSLGVEGKVKGRERGREEILSAVVEVVYDHVGCSRLFQILRYKTQPSQLQGLTRESVKQPEEVIRGAYIVAISKGWKIARPKCLATGRDLLFASDLFGSVFAAAAGAGQINAFRLLLDEIGRNTGPMHVLSARAYMTCGLQAAIFHGQTEAVDLLIYKRYKLHHGRTYPDMISYAATNNHFDFVRKMCDVLPLGYQFSMEEAMVTVCCMACKFGDDGYVRELMRKGYKFQGVEMRTYPGRTTPLALAARYNRVSTVKLLLGNGVKIDKGWEDAFVIAAKYGRLEVLRLFCARRLDKGCASRLEQALLRALKYAHLDVADFLWPKLQARSGRTLSNLEAEILKTARKSTNPEVLIWAQKTMKSS
jgi:hypothetical protein